jgi:thioredoxin-like negative regulator of GroEL
LVATLELPPYTPVRLRGSFTADHHFEKGMSSYQAGDCAAAASELKLVAAASPQWEGAQFYRGACLLKLDDAKGAAAALDTVARPDSAYDEPARYYLALAQHALGNDAAARKLLRQLAANKWDYAARAAAELQKLR